MMEASTNKPIQITGTPGETAALHVGIKRLVTLVYKIYTTYSYVYMSVW